MQYQVTGERECVSTVVFRESCTCGWCPASGLLPSGDLRPLDPVKQVEGSDTLDPRWEGEGADWGVEGGGGRQGDTGDGGDGEGV